MRKYRFFVTFKDGDKYETETVYCSGILRAIILACAERIKREQYFSDLYSIEDSIGNLYVCDKKDLEYVSEKMLGIWRDLTHEEKIKEIEERYK